MLAVALAGVAANVLAAWLLAGAQRRSLNVEGSLQHVLTDLYAFIGTALAAGVILVSGFAARRPDRIAADRRTDGARGRRARARLRPGVPRGGAAGPGPRGDRRGARAPSPASSRCTTCTCGKSRAASRRSRHTCSWARSATATTRAARWRRSCASASPGPHDAAGRPRAQRAAGDRVAVRILVGVIGGTLVVLMLAEIFLTSCCRGASSATRAWCARCSSTRGGPGAARAQAAVAGEGHDARHLRAARGDHEPGPVGGRDDVRLRLPAVGRGLAHRRAGPPCGRWTSAKTSSSAPPRWRAAAPRGSPRTAALARAVQVIDASSGLAVIATVIGYLPALYQAFSRREATVSQMDARAASPPSAGRLLVRSTKRGGWAAINEYLGELGDVGGRADGVTPRLPGARLLPLTAREPELAGEHVHRARRLRADNRRGTRGHRRRVPLHATRSRAMRSPTSATATTSTPPLPPRTACRRIGSKNCCSSSPRWASSRRPTADTLDARLGRVRALYEPYVNALALRLELPLPQWLAPESPTSNWRTTAWH